MTRTATTYLFDYSSAVYLVLLCYWFLLLSNDFRFSHSKNRMMNACTIPGREEEYCKVEVVDNICWRIFTWGTYIREQYRTTSLPRQYLDLSPLSGAPSNIPSMLMRSTTLMLMSWFVLFVSNSQLWLLRPLHQMSSGQFWKESCEPNPYVDIFDSLFIRWNNCILNSNPWVLATQTYRLIWKRLPGNLSSLSTGNWLRHKPLFIFTSDALFATRRSWKPLKILTLFWPGIWLRSLCIADPQCLNYTSSWR